MLSAAMKPKRLHCARCDSGILTDPEWSQWCRTCGVYVCLGCTGERKCPGGKHRLCGPAPWFASLIVVAAVCLINAGGVLFFDLQDAARAAIPVTPIDQINVGNRVKVSGILVGFSQGVIWPSYDYVSDTSYWTVSSFYVEDATGRVFVDSSPLHDVTGVRIIEWGIHNGGYWDGDAVSVIGTVQLDAYNETRLVAESIAQSPSSFAHFDLFLVVALGLGVASSTFAIIAPERLRQRVASHLEKAPAYPYRVRIWRRCPSCGHPVDVNLWACDLCGVATQWGA